MEQEQTSSTVATTAQPSKRLATENKKLRERVVELERENKALREFIGIGDEK